MKLSSNVDLNICGRQAAGAFVRVKSVLSGLHHEYSLATA
jgi:hypothetical protein